MIEEKLMKLGVERTGVPPIFAHGVHGRAASVGAHVLHVPVCLSTDRTLAVVFTLPFSFLCHYQRLDLVTCRPWTTYVQAQQASPTPSPSHFS
jgi:hypothetical protein